VFTAALIAFLTLASTADLPPALVVRAPADAPAAQKLASALSERMPAVRVVAGAAEDAPAGPDDLVVALVPGEPSWDLVVERRGAQALKRSLPAGSPGPDAAFFVACAAVVERYLQDIEWKGRPQSIAPAAIAEPKPAPAPPPVIAPPPEPEPVPLGWSVGASVAGASGLAGSVQQAVVAGQAQRRDGFWRIGPAIDVSVRRVNLMASLRAQMYVPQGNRVATNRGDGRPEQTGQLQDLAASASLAGGYCWGIELSLCGGLQLGWRGTYAWGQSGSASESDLFRWQLAGSNAFLAGLLARLSYRLPASLELRAQLAANGFFGDDGFRIEGDPDPVLMPPRFELGLSLGLARRVP